MAALGASFLVGPVPFKDVVDDDDHHISPSEEYADIISTMPSATLLGSLMRNYRGAWMVHEMVTGALAVERHFAPRPGDVLLASPPKCGTTWLKAVGAESLSSCLLSHNL